MFGILADQFGLGKTAQVAALLAHFEYYKMMGPRLIVCPTAGLEDWVSELQQLNPKVPVVMYHGSQQERQEIWEKYLEGGEHSSSSS
jgi:ATP-dependent DNA helicase